MNTPIYSDYKKYKPLLREEFFYACVYCDTRERELGGKKSFHIDHYKPKNQFPKLECQYENLLYSCRDCNSYKGSYWPNYVQRLRGQVILNKRIHTIDKHIDKSKPEWRGLTQQGCWNITRLRLTSPILVKRRDDRITLTQQIEKIKNDILACDNSEELANLKTLVDALDRKVGIGPLD